MKNLMYLIVAGFLFVFSACSGGASTEEAADVVVEEAAPAAPAQEVVNEDTVAEEAPAGHSH
jgi:23S rRNA G2069 N7-methylase RlmK/C1962 C5-methylase RlmI